MKRLWLFLCMLPVFFGLGCAADSEWTKGWIEVGKDLRGENMQMRSGASDLNRPSGPSGPITRD